MAKAEFVMLAHTYDRQKHRVDGWYMSEKLDGMRAIWDGGITRGAYKATVPWANTAKDARYKTAQRCTGLWTRYGHVIHAPDFWLDKLPKGVCLDGELYGPTIPRETLFSIVKSQTPVIPQWHNVCYYTFDMPHPRILFGNREIKNTNFKATFDEIVDSFEPLRGLVGSLSPRLLTFSEVKGKLQEFASHTLVPLPQQVVIDVPHIDKYMREVTDAGGEGVILRSPGSSWHPYRSYELLKYKFKQDDEGTVVGYTTGLGKYLGMMGALIVQYRGDKTFNLSGFTNQERTLSDPQWCVDHPDTTCPPRIVSSHFPIGSQVSFTYRELSDDGIPIEARYKRKRSSFGE
jgi:DNA ligase-1